MRFMAGEGGWKWRPPRHGSTGGRVASVEYWEPVIGHGDLALNCLPFSSTVEAVDRKPRTAAEDGKGRVGQEAPDRKQRIRPVFLRKGDLKRGSVFRWLLMLLFEGWEKLRQCLVIGMAPGKELRELN